VPLSPLPFLRVGNELRRKPFKTQLLFCWALGIFWIVVGVVVRTTAIWALVLGIVFLVAPFAALARQRGSRSRI